MKTSIRHCVLVSLGAIVGLLSMAAYAQAPTGSGGAKVAPFDAEIVALLKKYDVPGAAIAVARNGRLVVSRGDGVADRDSGRPVLPDTPFRIASLTKPRVAIATLILADKGCISLDTKIAAVPRSRLPVRTASALVLSASGTIRQTDASAAAP